MELESGWMGRVGLAWHLLRCWGLGESPLKEGCIAAVGQVTPVTQGASLEVSVGCLLLWTRAAHMGKSQEGVILGSSLPLLAAWPWGCVLISLPLSLFICKVRKHVSTSRGCFQGP